MQKGFLVQKNTRNKWKIVSKNKTLYNLNDESILAVLPLI